MSQPATPSRIKEIEERYSTGVYPKRDLVIVRGEGATLWDENGLQYVDCVGGQGSANIGHANPALADALAEQARRLVSCTEIFYNDRRSALLERLAGIAPLGIKRFFLCNSGAEAVEGAIKFARMSTGRTGIVATMRGFHGKTLGALSATWDRDYREMFSPLVPGFSHVPFNQLGALEEAVTEETAAVILEIVQGEGGVRVAERAYLDGVQRLCHDRGALLIVDEVQTGFARTGAMWACDHFGVVPDLLCLAKSLAGGVPMGAVGLGPAVGNVQKRSHTSTFGGNPLACAAALASIAFIQQQDLPARARELGERFLAGLREVQSPRVREIRGLGLMIGVELKEKTGRYINALAQRGVLALAAGPTVIRFLPPLVIEPAQVDFVVEQVAAVLAE